MKFIFVLSNITPHFFVFTFSCESDINIPEELDENVIATDETSDEIDQISSTASNKKVINLLVVKSK